MRRFEYKESTSNKEGTSNKFWEISVEGGATTVRFGGIGTEGRTQTKDHGSGDQAEKAALKLIKEKTAKGYVEVTPGAAGEQAEAQAVAGESGNPGGGGPDDPQRGARRAGSEAEDRQGSREAVAQGSTQGEVGPSSLGAHRRGAHLALRGGQRSRGPALAERGGRALGAGARGPLPPTRAGLRLPAGALLRKQLRPQQARLGRRLRLAAACRPVHHRLGQAKSRRRGARRSCRSCAGDLGKISRARKGKRPEGCRTRPGRGGGPVPAAGGGAADRDRADPRTEHRGRGHQAVEACKEGASKMAFALLRHLSDADSQRLAEATLSKAIDEDGPPRARGPTTRRTS